MTAIIAPINYSSFMRVDRNDVYWNLDSIARRISKLHTDCSRLPAIDYVVYYYDDEDYEAARRASRMSGNYRKLSSAQGDYKSALKDLDSLMEGYWDTSPSSNPCCSVHLENASSSIYRQTVRRVFLINVSF